MNRHSLFPEVLEGGFDDLIDSARSGHADRVADGDLGDAEVRETSDHSQRLSRSDLSLEGTSEHGGDGPADRDAPPLGFQDHRFELFKGSVNAHSNVSSGKALG